MVNKRNETIKGSVAQETRSSGVLLHLTSLPSPYEAGDMGPEAWRFVDFLSESGQRWWQMLPIVPPGNGNSPYSSYSAFAGSPWLISMEQLQLDGLLETRDLEAARSTTDKNNLSVDFLRNRIVREAQLHKAYENFRGTKDHGFDEFIDRNHDWLDDLTLYLVLRDRHGGISWNHWAYPFQSRQPDALREVQLVYADAVRFHQFVQYQFDRQWERLRKHCHALGVGLIGDLPIFLAYDSCDVWVNQHLFRLDKTGNMAVMTGCPPDIFNPQGQWWGHPHYHWPVHRKDGYHWWGKRFERMTRQFDAIRIDHFLGFERAWSIPATAPSARKGRWLRGPGREFFKAMKQKVGPFPVIVEDLGRLTAGAAKLRDDMGFSGMKILQFGFGNESHLPHAYVRNCVAYTGTHDNQTARGWFESLAPDTMKSALEYFGGDAAAISRQMIRSVMTSVANTVIVPMQDWLGLGDEARMNIPGQPDGCWKWRMRRLPSEMAQEMRQITEVTGRIG